MAINQSNRNDTRFHDWLLLPQRIALHEPTSTAVLADLHLGYCEARRLAGDAIPVRTVAEELQPLLDATPENAIQSIIIAGDLFERGFNPDLFASFLDELARARLRFTGLIAGNHDRGIDKASGSCLLPAGFELGGWQVAHGDQPTTPARTIMGHWHPAVFMRRRKVPCFLTSEAGIVLPAYSLDAAGVDVRRDARWHGWDCWAIDGMRVLGPEKL